MLADALDFGKSGPQLEDLEVVERTEGNNEVERLVAERIAVLRPVAEQIILDLGVGVGEPVFRYVEADQFGLGQQPLELAQQVALAAADIEDANLALQTVQVDQPLRHRRPAALDVAIAAIAVAPVAVPIVAFVFLRLQHAMNLLVHHPPDVVTLGGAVQRRHEIEQPAHAVSFVKAVGVGRETRLSRN